MRRSRTSELDMPRVIRGAKHVSRCEECQHIHERQSRNLHTLITQQSRTISSVQKSWSVLDTPVRRLREQCMHRKRAKIEDLDLFLRCCKHVMDTFQCTVIKKSVCVRWYTVQLKDWCCQHMCQQLNIVKRTDVQSRVCEH